MGTFLVIEEMRLKIESHFLKNRVLIVLVVSVYGDMINDQTVRSGLGKHLNVFIYNTKRKKKLSGNRIGW